MAQLDWVLIGGKDCGAEFALDPRPVVTATMWSATREDMPVVYVPTGAELVAEEQLQPDIDHNAPNMWLAGDDVGSLLISAAVRDAGWRVESPPGGSDPNCTGPSRLPG